VLAGRDRISGCAAGRARRRLSTVNAGRALTVPERDSLERDGYLLVPSLLDQAVLGRLRSRLDELVHQTVAAWDDDPEQATPEPGVVRVNFDADDRDFAACHDHPLLADAATAVLGPDWHVSGLLLRAPVPG